MNRDDIRRLLEQDPEAVIDLIEKLFDRIEELEHRINKDSRNSNRPPSSDGLSRKERRAQEWKSRKKRGGQNGHKGNQLKMSAKPDLTEVHRASRKTQRLCKLIFKRHLKINAYRFNK